ncbi:MAG: response regulator, partial [bacterium]
YLSEEFMIRILIIDDDAGIRESLRQALEDEFRVSTADSAEDAVAELVLSRPDVLVLDESMAGLNGTGLLALLDPENIPPAVMLCGLPDIKLARKAWGLGAEDVLSKPCDLESLKLRLRQVSGRRRDRGLAEAPLALRGARAGAKVLDEEGSLAQKTRRFGRALIAEAVAECRGDRALAARRLQVTVPELGTLSAEFSETAARSDFSL